jgi:hypothetical protein
MRRSSTLSFDGSKTLCMGNTVITDTRLLAVLREMLHDRGDDVIFPCIRDLIENALSVSRFSAGAQVPNRQDVTQYLAAWCKRVGLTEDACRGWLIEYCVAMLSPISNSTASRIRHSTKSNVRYVYRSAVSFACGCENNYFKVNCSRECPAYADMKAEFATAKSQEANVLHNAHPADAVVSPRSPVKETYRDQFQTALCLVRREIAKGTKKMAILGLLNQHGLKTRTGREWTYSILCMEIHKKEATSDCQCEPRKTGTPRTEEDTSNKADAGDGN